MRSTALLVMILLRAIVVLAELPSCEKVRLESGVMCELVVDKEDECQSVFGNDGPAVKLKRRDGQLICEMRGRWTDCGGQPPLPGETCEQVVKEMIFCYHLCEIGACAPQIWTLEDGTMVCVATSLFAKHHESLLSDQLRLNEYIKSRSYPTIAPLIFYPGFNFTPVQAVGVAPLSARITEVNEKQQAISVMMVIGLRWTDNRLAWNTSDFGGMLLLSVTRDSIWRPPITPINLISFSSDDALKPNVLIASDGQVLDIQIWNFRIAVSMEFKKFPFDRQTFYVTLRSMIGYIVIGPDYVLTSTESENEWQIIEDFEKVKTDDEKELTYKVTVKRYPYFWINLIIVPCFILGFLVISALTLGADTNSIEGLVNIGLAASVASAVVVTTMTDHFPKTEYVPSLTTFVRNQFFIIVAVLITIPIRKALMPKIDAALETWQTEDAMTVVSRNHSGKVSENAQEPNLRTEKELSGGMKALIWIVQIFKHRLFLFGLFGIIYIVCFAVMMRHVDLNFETKKRPDWLLKNVNLANFFSVHKGQ